MRFLVRPLVVEALVTLGLLAFGSLVFGLAVVVLPLQESAGRVEAPGGRRRADDGDPPARVLRGARYRIATFAHPVRCRRPEDARVG